MNGMEQNVRLHAMLLFADHLKYHCELKLNITVKLSK